MISFVHDKDFNFKGLNLAPKPSFATYESPERVRAIMDYLKSIRFLDRADISISPLKNLTQEDILRVHSPQHLQVVQNLSAYGGGEIGRWVEASHDTYQLALKSAGAAAKVLEIITDTVANLDADSTMASKQLSSKVAISLNRPPGHHARHDSTEGVCVFNNIALAIKNLRVNHQFMDKIAIIDIDAHFGNGTSSLFYDDPSVLHISLHESTFYGAQGMVNEYGAGKGMGTNINYRVPLGATDQIWLSGLPLIEQILRQFEPKILIVAMGFDGHWSDPLGNLKLTSQGYLDFAKWLKKVSEICDGRVGFVLEGGYSLLMLGRLVETILTPFLDNYTPRPPIDLVPAQTISISDKERMLRQLLKQNQSIIADLTAIYDLKLYS